MWRSKCNGTLAERVNELERELAPSRELLLKGGMPGPECFRGDALPDTLCVHLKRFEFDYETMQRHKIKSRFEFPETIHHAK